MQELLIPLKDSFDKSSIKDMEEWFSPYPEQQAWFLISDYCFSDKSKQNDTASFSILLNHDKLQNIKDYINAFAPKDIKSTRNISPEFLKYVNSPLIFNVTFVINRDIKLMRDYAGLKNMEEFLPTFEKFVQIVESYSLIDKEYFKGVYNRIKLYQRDFKKRNFNEKLSRQIHLVACFAGMLLYYLTKLKQPKYVQWISDRDAISERYDGFLFDLAFFHFLLLFEYNNAIQVEKKEDSTIIYGPKIFFLIPKKSGDYYFDALIRIPDYLAGTLADFDILNNTFSKEKYNTVMLNSIVTSKNHSIIQVLGNRNKVTARRICFTDNNSDNQIDEEINVLMDDSGLVTYIVPKEDILNCDFYGINDVINRLSRNEEYILLNRGKLEVLIGGYDDDSRESFEIPEIRQWYSKSIEAGVPWFYFLGSNMDMIGFKVFLLCFCDTSVKSRN
jgi:hypothetical protein